MSVTPSFISYPSCGYSSGQCGLQPAEVWCYYVSSLLFLACVAAPRSKLIQAADTGQSWKSVTCRCHMQEPRQRAVPHYGWYPNKPRWFVSCAAPPSFTPPRHSCVEQLFTSSSGYTCGCALASLVKPKRWPGILSFDPCVKGTLVTRLHAHDWALSFTLSFFCVISQLLLKYFFRKHLWARETRKISTACQK